MGSLQTRQILGLATLAIMLIVSTVSVDAQTGREVGLIEKLGMQDGNLDDRGATARNDAIAKLSPEELMQLRILQFKSGQSPSQQPDARTLIGPPLDERERVIHVMNRMAFGPRPGDIEKALNTGGWEVWAREQLDRKSIDNSAHQKDVTKRYPWTDMSLQQIKASYPIEDMAYANNTLRLGLPQSVIYRAALNDRQFEEVMAEFWRNHFCIDVPARDAAYRSWTAPHYEDKAIRKYMFGDFETLLMATAHHPAMLQYLDNWLSRKGAWNENYARELMELHTLGADRHYNETDVLELTKVLTGWSFDSDLNYAFNASQHEPGLKIVLGKKVAQGKGGGEFALEMLANHSGTAQFISEKLCKYLVNDNPPQSLVNKAKSTFKRTNGDLSKVYETIIFSPEFVSRQNYRAKFKTPLEFAVSAMRTTNATVTDTEETRAILAMMGMDIYQCLDPTGYYDQAEAWMDAGVLTRRWDYALKMVRGEIKGISISEYDLFHPFEGMEKDALVDAMLARFVGADVGETTRQVLLEAAEEGGAKRVLGILLGSPAYQQQ